MLRLARNFLSNTVTAAIEKGSNLTISAPQLLGEQNSYAEAKSIKTLNIKSKPILVELKGAGLTGVYLYRSEGETLLLKQLSNKDLEKLFDVEQFAAALNGELGNNLVTQSASKKLQPWVADEYLVTQNYDGHQLKGKFNPDKLPEPDDRTEGVKITELQSADEQYKLIMLEISRTDLKTFVGQVIASNAVKLR